MNEVSVGLKTRRRIIDETMASLGEYNLSEVQDFIRLENERRKLRTPIIGLKEDVIQRIQANIDKSIPAEDLLDYVDNLRENGHQLVFMYQLSPKHRDYLKELRRPDHIKHQLEKNGLPACYNKPLHIWETRIPQLAAVLRRRGPNDVLVFKWVETRLEQVKEEIGEDKHKNPIWVMRPVKKRAVSHFFVNLQNGDSELRIQEMESNARKNALDEREKYEVILQNIIRFDYFRLVPLEPVIHKLVLNPTKAGEVKDWKILLPDDKTLEGSGVPNFSQWIGILWNTFAGDTMKIDWQAEDDFTKIRLDAQTNGLRFREFIDAEHATAVLNKARDYSEDKIEHPSLIKLAEQDDRHVVLLKKLDTLISKLEMNDIDCGKLTADGSVSFEAIAEVLDKMNSEFPNVFQNKYQIVCPDSRKPIQKEDGSYLEYRKVGEIPSKVLCREKRHRTKTYHPTRGNIKPILSYVEPPKTPLADGVMEWADQPKGLIDRLQGTFGKVLGRKVIKALFLLIFGALYVGLTWITVRIFLPFLQQYPNQKILIVVPYFIILLLLIVLLVALFGIKTIEKSITFLKLLTKAIFNTVFPVRRKLEVQAMSSTDHRQALQQKSDSGPVVRV
jgi:hypothetical protein